MDVEILDMHDNTKLDAPSGTAKEIGEIVADARGVSLEEEAVYGRCGVSPRRHGNIGFHSLRGGDIPSSHTTYFVGTSERLEITHHPAASSPCSRCSRRSGIHSGQAEGLLHH